MIQHLTIPELLDFLLQRKIYVVKIESKGDLDYSFNPFLKSSFKNKYKNQIDFALINGDQIDQSNTLVNITIRSWLNKLGLNQLNQLPSGFYLFVNSSIEGYHPATLTTNFNEEEMKLMGISSIAGLFSGLLVGLAEKSFDKGLETFATTFETPQALKVFSFFSPIIEKIINSKSSNKQKIIIKSELEKAYELLGVSAFATDDEIKIARNNIIREHHPDKNPDHFEEKNKYISAINNAYDLIFKFRNKKN